MNEWIKGLMAGSVAWLAGNAHGYAFDLVKIRGTIWYLQAVRTARSFYLLGLLTTLGAALAGAGLVLLHIGLYLLLPARAHAIVLLSLGVVYIAAGICIIARFTSEKRWMRTSGANKTCAALISRRSRPN